MYTHRDIHIKQWGENRGKMLTPSLWCHRASVWVPARLVQGLPGDLCCPCLSFFILEIWKIVTMIMNTYLILLILRIKWGMYVEFPEQTVAWINPATMLANNYSCGYCCYCIFFPPPLRRYMKTSLGAYHLSCQPREERHPLTWIPHAIKIIMSVIRSMDGV